MSEVERRDTWIEENAMSFMEAMDDQSKPSTLNSSIEIINRFRGAAWIENFPRCLVGLLSLSMKRFIQRSQPVGFKIKSLHISGSKNKLLQVRVPKRVHLQFQAGSPRRDIHCRKQHSCPFLPSPPVYRQWDRARHQNRLWCQQRR